MKYTIKDAEYYQALHDNDIGYQTNNWLVDELGEILKFNPTSILELACGNGKFLDIVSKHVANVNGCDWAVSPKLLKVLRHNPNIKFHKQNLYESMPNCESDMVVSADFLEHIDPNKLVDVLTNIDRHSSKALHKIACYDDGHSHLTIISPDEWLALFNQVNPEYKILKTEVRPGPIKKEMVVIVKGM